MPSPHDFSIEIHRHNVGSWTLFSYGATSRDGTYGQIASGGADGGKTFNLVEGLSVISNTDAPYSRLTLDLNWPLSLRAQGPPLSRLYGGKTGAPSDIYGPTHPTTGDWIIVRFNAPDDPSLGSTQADLAEWPVTDYGSAEGNFGPALFKGAQMCNCFMGVVTSQTARVSTSSSGAVKFSTMKVTAESWLDYLGRVQIGLLTDVAGGNVGTLIKRNSWLRTWSSFVEHNVTTLSTGSESLGSYLEKLFRMSARVLLPDTIFGKDTFLGDVVRVVHNNGNGDTTDAHKGHGGAQIKTAQLMRDATGNVGVAHDSWTRRARACEKVPGWKWLGAQSFNPQSTTVLDLIRGSFGADRLLVELFPSMEATNDQTIAGTPALSFANETISGFRDGVATGIRGDNDLAATGGFAPVLIYRMRPWRAESLGTFVRRINNNARIKNLANTVSAEGAARAGVEQTSGTGSAFVVTEGDTVESTEDVSAVPDDDLATLVGLKSDQISGGDVTFGRYGKPADVEHRFYSNMVFECTFSKSVNDHITAATIDLINDPLGMLSFSQSMMGLPLFIDNEVETHGLRLFRTQWPFWSFPRSTDLDELKDLLKGDLLTYWRWMGLTAWQFVGGMHQYHTGIVKVVYSPQVNPGCAVMFSIPNPAGGGETTVYGYIEQVEHSMTVDNSTGVQKRHTSIQFSRALFDEDFDSVKPNQYSNARLNPNIPKAVFDLLKNEPGGQ